MSEPRSERTIWLVAGEDSGDQLGAKLMRGLRELSDRPIRFGGVGGEAMAAEGFASLFPIDDVAVMGYLPVAARLRTPARVETVERARLVPALIALAEQERPRVVHGRAA